ncbi:Dolichol kinase EVAN [Vitis vinifera]|uniref:Dolichol kinase EVAN n=1 Tax=Vitis vinifera TaxID=29760 RepID=A0A438F3L5_VITVI|nr:Dolichol kinase EVAN [Vitis vinifera]
MAFSVVVQRRESRGPPLHLRYPLLTPSSLFSQALVLFLLAIAALFLDIRLDNSNFSVPFKTRPGASSGIFLGAVTLPAVMISRLIQLSRAFSLHEVGIKVAFTYHKFPLFSEVGTTL